MSTMMMMMAMMMTMMMTRMILLLMLKGRVNDYNEDVEYDVDISDIITVDFYRYDGKNIYNILPQSTQWAKICL